MTDWQMVVLVLDCWPCYTERVDPEFLRLGPNYYDIVAMDLGSPKDQSEVILSRCRGMSGGSVCLRLDYPYSVESPD